MPTGVGAGDEDGTRPPRLTEPGPADVPVVGSMESGQGSDLAQRNPMVPTLM